MNFLEERIVKDGIVKEGNVLKVDSFLNHQMDIKLLNQMGAEFTRNAGEHVQRGRLPRSLGPAPLQRTPLPVQPGIHPFP